jgi:hypothetical protein
MKSFVYHLKTLLSGIPFGLGYFLGFVWGHLRDGCMFGMEEYEDHHVKMVEEHDRRLEVEITKRENSYGHFLGV